VATGEQLVLLGLECHIQSKGEQTAATGEQLVLLGLITYRLRDRNDGDR